MAEKKDRYPLIDAIRGITVISMVIYHFMYDYNVAFGTEPLWWTRYGVHIWQQTICWSFILISGFVWPWGKKHLLRRVIVLNLLGLGITLVTWLFMPEQVVIMGILNFLGTAMGLMFLLEKPLKKLEPTLGLAVFFVLFLLCKQINAGHLSLPGLFRIRLPQILYDIKILMPLGFPAPGFRSSDYFAILPWMLLYICGYYLGRIFETRESRHGVAGIELPVLSFIGKRSLWIYILHQPLNMLICSIILSQPLF